MRPDHPSSRRAEDLTSSPTQRVLHTPPARRIRLWNFPGELPEHSASFCGRYQRVADHVRILLVEDAPLIREFVADALREDGHNVIHAANGEEALAWCKRKVAEVLITDTRLPGQIDGWQIAERCRDHDPEKPVIYATGFSHVQHRPVAGSLVLQKPNAPSRSYRPSRM